MKPCRHKSAGFTLIEIMTVMGIMGLLVTLALPNLIRARATSQTRICITNLNKIESIKQNWGLDHAKTLNDIPTDADLIGPTLYLRKKPVCPTSGLYEYNALKDNATCTTPGHTL
jgi:prepilin-type N-terminal cleavage/methylation domain-containing protein